jgi:hypothetical protein
MSSKPPVNSASIIAFPGRPSSGKAVEQKVSPADRVVVPFAKRRVVGFYARCPDLWMRFIRAHFADHQEVAVFFRISDRAAEKWWDGIGAARADKLLLAMQGIAGCATWWQAELAQPELALVA